MTIKNRKIRYGNVELDNDEFDRRNLKIRVTMMIDADIVDRYKNEAEKKHTKYQTLMNQKLREAFVIQDDLESRIKLLEQKVFRKVGVK